METGPSVLCGVAAPVPDVVGKVSVDGLLLLVVLHGPDLAGHQGLDLVPLEQPVVDPPLPAVVEGGLLPLGSEDARVLQHVEGIAVLGLQDVVDDPVGIAEEVQHMVGELVRLLLHHTAGVVDAVLDGLCEVIHRDDAHAHATRSRNLISLEPTSAEIFWTSSSGMGWSTVRNMSARSPDLPTDIWATLMPALPRVLPTRPMTPGAALYSRNIMSPYMGTSKENTSTPTSLGCPPMTVPLMVWDSPSAVNLISMMLA